MILDFSIKKLTIRQPDDWHVHLRDGALLSAVVASTARVFGRAIVMPNLDPPITTLDQALQYRQRILDALPKGVEFTPLMTAYLTDDFSPQILETGHRSGLFTGAKLYPANATTNSSYGVTDLGKIDSLLEMMECIDMPLLIHGEVTDKDVDIFDREKFFIQNHLEPLLRRYQGLRVILEHITTKDAVDFVAKGGPKLAATITPHHLHINRNAIFQGGLRSDFYCLPVAKRESHRIALRKAAVSAKSCFFLGTDSAPHTRQSKESSCGCAGIFNALHALESYIQVFDEEDALDRFETFASINGPKFYGLPLNTKTITLIRKQQLVRPTFNVSNNKPDDQKVVPFHAGEYLNWSISSD